MLGNIFKQRLTPLLKVLDSTTETLNVVNHCCAKMREEMLLNFVPAEQWDIFNQRVFTRTRLYRGKSYNSDLHQWEKEIVMKYFPDLPARVLVTACGGGREMTYLARMGYSVAGFDISKKLLDNTESLISNEKLLGLEHLSYEKFSGIENSLDTHAPYDAIICGWGSFSHIGSRFLQEKVLAKLRRLCPQGPIVLSWIAMAPAEGKTADFRRYLHRKGLYTTQALESRFDAANGFVRRIETSDITGLAAATGSKAILSPRQDVFPHSVLLPNESSMVC